LHGLYTDGQFIFRTAWNGESKKGKSWGWEMGERGADWAEKLPLEGGAHARTPKLSIPIPRLKMAHILAAIV